MLKSGCRFVDEKSVFRNIQAGLVQEVYLNIVDEDQSIKKKQNQVKASFKIQMEDEERKARDSTQTTQYHTGDPN